MKIGEVVRDGDFKAEKHVPTIEAPEKIKAGEEALVKVCVGKEIKHPNTPLHHISWIQRSSSTSSPPKAPSSTSRSSATTATATR